ncbi:MAG: D-alanine--D-alanine ligase family protein [Thermovirgaceae bacterium]
MHSVSKNVLVTVAIEDTGREDVLDAQRCCKSVLEALERSGYRPLPFEIRGDDLRAPSVLAMRILKEQPGCVFNLFEGFSEAPFLEPAFAAILEEIETPFTGNGSKALSDCLDKDRTRKMLSRAGLPVPPGLCIHSVTEKSRLESLDFPLFVKPRCEDSSVGINSDSVVRDRSLLETLLAQLFEDFPDGLVVEKYLPGTEYNAGCMGAAPYEFLALSSIQYRPEKKTSDFLGYDSKWKPESLDYQEIGSCIEQDLSLPLHRRIRDMCLKAGEVMGCRGYFRVDFRERNGEVFILEVNPNPDINTDSGFARQSAAAGYDYSDMIAKLVELALEGGRKHVRHGLRPTHPVDVR